MSTLTDLQRRRLTSWAARNPQIRRVVLFGSRVKGTHRANSDLDIAIELEAGEDSNATLANWMQFSNVWKREVSAIVPFEVDLQWLDRYGATSVIEQGVKEANEVVYARAS